MSQITKEVGSMMELENVQTIQQHDLSGSSEVPTALHVADNTGSHRKTKEERTLVTKIDLIFVPLSALLYIVAYLVRLSPMFSVPLPRRYGMLTHFRMQDRGSIGNARIMGMQKELRLTSKQWSNCLSMFFVGYCVLMLPGNLLIRKIRPNRYIGTIALTFGALVVVMSVAQNYGTALALRMIIGAVQAFMQGGTMYASLWYKRDEIATRSAFIYWAATLAGAFSGLIAYGVDVDLTTQATSKAPWRWLFIIEGSMGMVVGVIIWILLPQVPDRLRQRNWLFTSHEIELAKARSASYNTIGSGIDPRQILKTFIDPKSWAFAMISAAIGGFGVNSLSLFLPTFVEALGFSAERTQLFSVVPYACASVVVPICLVSDRLNVKGPFLLVVLSVANIGYIVLLCDVPVAGKITAACLVTSGVYPAVVLLNAWIVTNTAGYTKRATTWAMAEIFSPCFAIMSSYVYNTPPRFIKGHAIALGFMATGIAMVVFLMWWMNRANKQRDAKLRDYAEIGMVHPHKTRSLEEEQDLHVDFRYIL